MSDTLNLILVFVVLSIGVLICSFLCILSQYKDVLWQTLTNTRKNKKGAKNG